MSVCMSAVSAGISEVLIKYTGNVWLQINIYAIHIPLILFYSYSIYTMMPEPNSNSCVQ